MTTRSSCSWRATTRRLQVLSEAGLAHIEKRGRERAYHVQSDYVQRVVGDWVRWLE